MSQASGTSSSHATPLPLTGERVTFTGTLASMTHADAAELVLRHGGQSVEYVSRQLTLLVVGEEGWPLEDDGRHSLKLREAVALQQQGTPVRILNESDFLKIVGLADQQSEVRRLHTPAMLSRMLGIPVNLIRNWSRTGLLRPVKQVHRLPYFDFQEVSSLRRLNDLLQAGVSQSEIERSLRSLPVGLHEGRKPWDQLELLAVDRRIVLRDSRGLKELHGQRLFDFGDDENTVEYDEAEGDEHQSDEPHILSFLEARHTALDRSGERDWFVEGCRMADDDELDSAVEAFRLALMVEPTNPEVHFHLGDALYRLRWSRAALERFYAAVEIDHDYVESWMQIGSIHRELDELDVALDAFAVALDIHPELPDAHYLRAQTLVDLGSPEEAVPHWQEYLRHDWRGPWAEVARQQLQQQNAELPPIPVTSRHP
ncbi:MAG: tetratricopeptide repeat protein [Planctomycetaceae bacterium]